VKSDPSGGAFAAARWAQSLLLTEAYLEVWFRGTGTFPPPVLKPFQAGTANRCQLRERCLAP
jgi:hypothetical protein